MAVIQAATRYAFHRPGRRRPTTSRKATSRATRLSFTRYTATSPSWAMIQAAIPLSSWRPSDNPMWVVATSSTCARQKPPRMNARLPNRPSFFGALPAALLYNRAVMKSNPHDALNRGYWNRSWRIIGSPSVAVKGHACTIGASPPVPRADPDQLGTPPGTDLGGTGLPLFAEDLPPAHQQVGKAKHEAAHRQQQGSDPDVPEEGGIGVQLGVVDRLHRGFELLRSDRPAKRPAQHGDRDLAPLLLFRDPGQHGTLPLPEQVHQRGGRRSGGPWHRWEAHGKGRRAVVHQQDVLARLVEKVEVAAAWSPRHFQSGNGRRQRPNHRAERLQARASADARQQEQHQA